MTEDASWHSRELKHPEMVRAICFHCSYYDDSRLLFLFVVESV